MPDSTLPAKIREARTTAFENADFDGDATKAALFAKSVRQLIVTLPMITEHSDREVIRIDLATLQKLLPQAEALATRNAKNRRNVRYFDTGCNC